MLPILDTTLNLSREIRYREERMIANIEEGNIEPGNIQADLDALHRGRTAVTKHKPNFDTPG